jgi:hypothetical protein
MARLRTEIPGPRSRGKRLLPPLVSLDVLEGAIQ